MAALIGASRILQALARDDLLPFLSFFAKGFIKGDEPRRALVLTYVLSQVRKQNYCKLKKF